MNAHDEGYGFGEGDRITDELTAIRLLGGGEVGVRSLAVLLGASMWIMRRRDVA